MLKSWGYEGEFPILVKMIDAKDRLSVQVHPDNEYALKNEGEYGKTEMWYIVDCEPGARLVYGFKRKISKDEFKERINENTLDSVMNFVPVKKGDVFFIKAGTLHAIGEGILIAEIQQNSNTTYRVSDYGRVGADGKKRELHIEKALDVTVTDCPSVPYGQVGEISEHEYGTERKLAACEYFKAVWLKLNGKKEFFSQNSFVSILVIDGAITVKYYGGSFGAGKGGSILIPRNLRAHIEVKGELICSEA